MNKKLHKLSDLSLQGKISSIYILTNLLVCLVNILLVMGINRMSGEMELVYFDNLNLNRLSGALDAVQNSMTDYLNAKTSDSLEEYYRSSQYYQQLVDALGDEISGVSFDRMKRNIRHMSGKYLEIVDQTIAAKRGRNVEKYRVQYESATQMYDYITTYIYSLNNQQFKNNSENYTKLAWAFRLFETVGIGVIFAVIIINVFIITKLVGAIIGPLRTLARSADEVANGNFKVELPEVQTGDEIGVLSRAFNQMVVSIREYIDRIRHSMEVERVMKEKELLMEAHLKDAQLKYLQAQINPHFLFNTLNAGAQLAMLEDADRTYRYVQNVAEFFRYNVKKSDETVTLREEIELVDNYIYILNVRFSGDIHYEKEVDPSLLQVEIPGMILQPIVENCVNHGIREMAGEGRIWLKVYRIEDTACISIRDNGAGMSVETIAKVLNGTYRKEELPAGSNGIGMDNVIARLRLFTESGDVMSIMSGGTNQGTEFIIYLPDRERGEDNV
ncbi:MAG: histidine kinase [Blautia sp.]|nr:histidine kinase [Blautia sp.]MCM1201333.1 histidine kinase [Bacteroides fragilis]